VLTAEALAAKRPKHTIIATKSPAATLIVFSNPLIFAVPTFIS
jgi:hypothetical protein